MGGPEEATSGSPGTTGGSPGGGSGTQPPAKDSSSHTATKAGEKKDQKASTLALIKNHRGPPHNKKELDREIEKQRRLLSQMVEEPQRCRLLKKERQNGIFISDTFQNIMHEQSPRFQESDIFSMDPMI